MNYTYKQFKHGQKVTCKIDGTKITHGKISINKDGEVYICQNKMRGANADDKLGYKYSWIIFDKDWDFTEGINDVTDLKLLDITETSPLSSALWGISYERETDPVELFKTKKEAEKRIEELVNDKEVKNILLFEIGKKYKVEMPRSYKLVEI